MKKLNLGAGATVIDGFEPRDGEKGDVLFPLPDADASVDELRASHVLEHFPHGQIGAVIADWVRVLKPGGVLKIAVPDFQHVAERYVAGEEVNVQGYVMGGQSDERDFHKALFDRAGLEQALRNAGLIGIRDWKSEIEDCAALPVSLNLAATKPGARPKIAAICSMPRLGFNDFWGVAIELLRRREVSFYRSIGVYWGKKMTEGIKEILKEKPETEWILTLDYDTVFTPAQFEALVDLAVRHPEADAIAPIQASRHHKTPMLTVPSEDGTKNRPVLGRDELNADLLQIRTAHFGCTLIRVEKLLQLPKPWFKSEPDPQGEWGPGSIDDDIWFWHQWRKAGFTLFAACRVPVGHLDLAVRWPDINLEAVWQTPRDFLKGGPPPEVWR
jgi:SAM-dependent methyltransferase